VLCLAEKPVRVFVAGEGGTGKTHVVSNILLNAAYRLFLGKYCDAQPLAFTNRAAGLYGSGAQTVMGYIGARPSAGKKRGGGGMRTGCGGPLPGSGADVGARATREERMRGTEAYVLDEVSQLDSALYDDHNKGVYLAREARDRLTRCDALAGHHVHPFGMTRLVVTAGDFAQCGQDKQFPGECISGFPSRTNNSTPETHI